MEAILNALAGLESDLRSGADVADSRTYDSRATLTDINVAVGMEAAYSEAADLIAELRTAFTPTLVVVGDVGPSALVRS